MNNTAETFLYKCVTDDEIKEHLLVNGWAEKGHDFFEKAFRDFRIILERENDTNYGWHFLVTGNFRLNNNVVLEAEIKALKDLFTGFALRNDAYNRVVGHEVVVEEAEKDDPGVGDSFIEDKDKIQYLVAQLLSTSADFIFDKEYFIAYYADKSNDYKLRLKIIKVAEQVNVHFDKNGDLYYSNGERLF